MMLLSNKWKAMSKGHKTTVVAIIVVLLAVLCISISILLKNGEKKTENSENNKNVILNQEDNKDNDGPADDKTGNDMTIYEDSESAPEVIIDGSGNWDEGEPNSSDNSGNNSASSDKQQNGLTKDDATNDSEKENDKSDKEASVMPDTVDEGNGVIVEYNWGKPH